MNGTDVLTDRVPRAPGVVPGALEAALGDQAEVDGRVGGQDDEIGLGASAAFRHRALQQLRQQVRAPQRVPGLPGVQPLGQRAAGRGQRRVQQVVRGREVRLRTAQRLHAQALPGVVGGRRARAGQAAGHGPHGPDLRTQVGRARRIERDLCEQPFGVVREPSGVGRLPGRRLRAQLLGAAVDQHGRAAAPGGEPVDAQRRQRVVAQPAPGRAVLARTVRTRRCPGAGLQVRHGSSAPLRPSTVL
ncbi:hypothetical protein [Streptomonospora nanhaiensis]|uniref:hypothetical protein n=1 Tax=Streptomonospora nanhaiensis TaxID=1323731 RepID=UPI001C3895C6|nr:hypothetical protein [Streptomonospora nanhaiensis]MBV2366540.1 hypothetical protein [Streptomonospora nanhaiensis]